MVCNSGGGRVKRLEVLVRGFISALAILTIGVVECIALNQGIDSYMLGLSIAVIAGLAGYNVKRIKEIILGK